MIKNGEGSATVVAVSDNLAEMVRRLMVYEVYRNLPMDVRQRLHSALEGYERCKHSPPMYSIGDTVAYSRELWNAGDLNGPIGDFHAVIIGVRFNSDVYSWEYAVIENPTGDARHGSRCKVDVFEENITGLSDKPWYEVESSG